MESVKKSGVGNRVGRGMSVTVPFKRLILRAVRAHTCCYRRGPKSLTTILRTPSAAGTPRFMLRRLNPRLFDALQVEFLLEMLVRAGSAKVASGFAGPIVSFATNGFCHPRTHMATKPRSTQRGELTPLASFQCTISNSTKAAAWASNSRSG
jgi:hypothetical protein